MRSTSIALVSTILGAATLASAVALAPVAEAKKDKAKKDKEQCNGPLKFRRLATGTSSGIHENVIVSIGDEVAFKELWNRHTSNITPKPPLPKVNFKKEMVIGIFDGDKPTGGYTVTVKKIIPAPKVIKVMVATGTPPKGSMTAQVVTQPFDIVATTKDLSAPVQRHDIGSK
jgi:hypothetical protein